MESTKKLCGKMGGRVNDPWKHEHEIEVEEMRMKISEVETERNMKVQRMKAMGILRERQRHEKMRVVR